MSSPRVWNKRDGDVPSDAVYVGRPSKWGNPFVIGPDGDRAEVVAKYKAWLVTTDLIGDVWQLIGKDLVCWCSPLACHADVLVSYAKAEETLEAERCQG